MANSSQYKITESGLVNNPPPNATLGQKVQVTLTNAFISFFNSIIDPFVNLAKEISHQVFKFMADSLVSVFRPYLTIVINDNRIDANVRNMIASSINSGQQVAQITGVANGLVLLGLTIIGGISVLQRVGEYEADRLQRTNRLDPATLAKIGLVATRNYQQFANYMQDLGLPNDLIGNIFSLLRQFSDPQTLATLERRGQVDSETVVDSLIKQGYTDKEIGIFRHAIENWLTVSDLANAVVQNQMSNDSASAMAHKLGMDNEQFQILVNVNGSPPGAETMLQAWNRGFATESEVDQALKESRLKNKYNEMVKKLRFAIPGISDLIRFMVREAFDDNISAKFGYDAEYPDRVNEFLTKNGLDPDWGKRYWRAHWELPSPTQAYEMLHRGLITVSDLESLLKTADYPPFWRDKLVAISYNPFTRVDVRRMFRLGILDHDGVFKSYKDIGYDNDHAEKLTQFTVADVRKEQKDLSQSQLFGLFEDGIISENELTESLNKLGYDATEIGYQVQAEKLKLQHAIINDKTKSLQTKYIDGLINTDFANSGLSTLGYSQDAIRAKVELWDSIKQGRIEKPSVSVLQNWYKEDVISIDQFKEELVKTGWIEPYITDYIKYVSTIKANEQKKDLETKLKEQERLESSKQKNDYRMAIAGLDIDIAELKASIAEAELGIFLSDNQDVKDSLRRQILEQKANIADKQVLKAKLVPTSISTGS